MQDIRVEKLLFNLSALAELGEELTSTKDFNRIVRSSLYMIMGNFSTTKGAILQFDSQNKTLKIIASKGLDNPDDLTIRISEKGIEELINLKLPVDLHKNGKAMPFFISSKTDLNKLHARILTPLIVKENLLGFVSLGEKFNREAYTKDDFRLISVMANHTAVSLYSHLLLRKLMHKYNENKSLYEDLSRIYYDTILAFATAIDAKDAYTKGHSHRVSAYCTTIAEEMGVISKDVEAIRIAGLLHDIGKLAIDKTVINKDSPLTKNELVELNSHPVVGYEILSKIKFPWKDISKTIRAHHERVDGTGYPDRLKNNQIPFSAKIMSLADSFDAMTTNRPYRPALSAKQVLKELRENCDRQFDRDVMSYFFSLIKREVVDKAKPTITPLLSKGFINELREEIVKGGTNWILPKYV